MNRKEFIKSCGFACLGGSAFLSVLQSCGTAKMVNGTLSGSDLFIPLADFAIEKEGEPERFKKYVVVHHDQLQFPVCVYRFSEQQYTALWMQCTHQGAELQVFGDKLQCPAHGSEFDTTGHVQNGPADIPLRTFPVIVENDRLKISLK